MSDNPNYHHRIVAAKFLAEVVKIPEHERAQWVLNLALDLVNDDKNSCQTSFGKKIITETTAFREKCRNAGKLGGLAKSSNAKATLRNAIANSSDPLANSSDPLPNSNSNNNNNSKNKNHSDFSLPEWIDNDTWDAYVDMRKKIKKPLTDHAAKLVINKLAKMMEDGQDPKQVLEQSIIGGWQGIFEVKASASKPSGTNYGQY